MPRAEFHNIGEAVAWLEQMTAKKRTYVGYFTDAEELVIQPTTSTAPVTYGYVEKCTVEEAKKMVQQRFDVPVLHCKRYEFNHDNTIKKD